MSRLSRQCGILNISQPYRPLRPVTGITLLFKFFWGREVLKGKYFSEYDFSEETVKVREQFY
jgi:hypothetical protein